MMLAAAYMITSRLTMVVVLTTTGRRVTVVGTHKAGHETGGHHRLRVGAILFLAFLTVFDREFKLLAEALREIFPRRVRGGNRRSRRVHRYNGRDLGEQSRRR